MPRNLLGQLVEAAGTDAAATRALSGKVIQKVAELVPSFVSGPHQKGLDIVFAESFGLCTPDQDVLGALSPLPVNVSEPPDCREEPGIDGQGSVEILLG